VKWEKGTRADGLDSKAVQVADREHWPEMEALILIVCDTEKDTPSTEGMQNSVATSPLLAYRAEHVGHCLVLSCRVLLKALTPSSLIYI
jgi:diphosphomevalonate decarboxylase